MRLQATPRWADPTKILDIYQDALELSELLGCHHVDHIIPLKNDMVCGLHTHDNLQILSKEANLTKNNKLLPDTDQRYFEWLKSQGLTYQPQPLYVSLHE